MNIDLHHKYCTKHTHTQTKYIKILQILGVAFLVFEIEKQKFCNKFSWHRFVCVCARSASCLLFLEHFLAFLVLILQQWSATESLRLFEKLFFEDLKPTRTSKQQDKRSLRSSMFPLQLIERAYKQNQFFSRNFVPPSRFVWEFVPPYFFCLKNLNSSICWKEFSWTFKWLDDIVVRISLFILVTLTLLPIWRHKFVAVDISVCLYLSLSISTIFLLVWLFSLGEINIRIYICLPANETNKNASL